MAEQNCLDIVRAGDKDIFLATLFAPEIAQPHLFALHAFAVEVARIPRLVSEAQIGEIRLQWWADTLDAIAKGEAQSHPVAKALADAIQQHSLPIAPLLTLVEARRFDLYADAMPDVTAMEAYFGETQSVLFQLACLVLNPTAAPKAAMSAGFAGVAFGLSRALLAAETTAKILPTSTSREALLTLAETRFSEARAAISALTSDLLPAFLPLAIVPLNLAAAKCGAPSVSQWRKQWQLWRAARREVI